MPKERPSSAIAGRARGLAVRADHDRRVRTSLLQLAAIGHGAKQGVGDGSLRGLAASTQLEPQILGQ